MRIGARRTTRRQIVQALGIGAGVLGGARRVRLPSAEPLTPPLARGTSMMLTGTPEQTRDADGSVFAVSPGERLLLRLIFISRHELPTEFRLLCLLNYRQVSFGCEEVAPLVDDPYSETYADLVPWTPTVPTSKVMEFAALLDEPHWFHLWTEPLDPGYHDLAFIVVPDFRLTANDVRYITSYRPFLRGAVYVGPAVPPNMSFPILDPTARTTDTMSGDSLLFCTEPYSTQMKSAADVEPGTEITLTANWAPTDINLADNQLPDSPLPTAFVGFLEDRQVPINGQEIIYGAGVPGTFSYLPIAITSPTTPGTHQFFLQQFPNPYIDPAYAYETGREFFAESSQRFRLEVALV